MKEGCGSVSLMCFTKLHFSLEGGMFPTMKNDVNTYLWAIAKNLWNALKREILFYCPAFWLL